MYYNTTRIRQYDIWKQQLVNLKGEKLLQMGGNKMVRLIVSTINEFRITDHLSVIDLKAKNYLML